MEKILIVEDDRATRKALQQLFEAEGFAVETAQNGAEGLAVFRATKPSFVILDLQMPQMGGRDACRDIRKQSEDVPIIILTGSVDEVNRVLLLELGADDYVTKPFSPKELLARVRAVLRRSKRGNPAIEQLYFGDVSVDFGRMEVTRAERSVALTPQDARRLGYGPENLNFSYKVVTASEIWPSLSSQSTRQQCAKSRTSRSGLVS